MDPFIIRHMLPHVVDSHIHKFHRIQGAPAVLGSSRRMGRPAPESEGRLDVGLVGSHHHFVLGPGMPGKGCIHVSKSPFPGQVGFAAAPFFRRASIDPYGPLAGMGGQVILQEKACPHCRRAQKAVAAAVAVGIPFPGLLLPDPVFLAETAQGIIFSQDGDHRLPAAVFRHKGGGHVGQSPGHLEAVALQQILHGLGGLEFLEFQFRKVPDTGIQFLQFLFIGFQIHGFRPPFFNNCCTTIAGHRLFYFFTGLSRRASSSSRSRSRASS